MQAINARAASIIRYRAGIVEWRKNEVEAIDRKTTKLLTMHRSLHPRRDVDRLYWKRKNNGQGLTSVEECVKISLVFLPGRTKTTSRSSN